MEHFNKLTPAEAERLACLLEEMGEAIQIIGKIQRHGYESHNPLVDNPELNRHLLEKELGDVVYSLMALTENQDTDGNNVIDAADRKRISIQKWLHH